MEALFELAFDLLKAFWKGPFHIGPLSQPVSVGDVLLKVLETLWRIVITLIYGVAIIALSAFLWVKFVEPWWFPPAKKFVTAYASYDDGSERTGPPPKINLVPKGQNEPVPPIEKPFRCSPDYPLKVEIRNYGKKSVQETVVSVRGRLEGFTTSPVNYPYLKSPRILAPQHGWISCYSIQVAPGVDPANLDYTAEVVGAEFADDNP